jgi:hypothetical protein
MVRTMGYLKKEQIEYLSRMGDRIDPALPVFSQDPEFADGGFDMTTDWDYRGWVDQWREAGLVRDETGPVEDAVFVYLQTHERSRNQLLAPLPNGRPRVILNAAVRNAVRRIDEERKAAAARRRV